MSGTQNELGELHGLIARILKDQIVNGGVVVTKEGESIPVPVTPAVLNVARQFLRDNNIECAGASNKDIMGLVEELPFESAESVRPH